MSKKLSRILLLSVIAVGIALALIYRDQLDATALEQWVSDAGSAGPVVFMLIYTLATIFFLPGSIITLAGGALFGPVWGTLYNLLGATLGATISFWIARYLGADWVDAKTGGRLKQLKQGVEGEGWKFVAFVRLVPLFPFNALNYALGLTRISSWHYVIASFIFMLPGGFAYTYLGYAGREAIGGGEGTIQKIMLAIALLAIVGFIPSLIGRLRRGAMMDVATLKQKLDANEDVMVLDVRKADEFNGEQGHIVQAINIALEDLGAQLERLSGRIEKPIAIVCITDRRSAKAAQLLVRNGYADVHVVQQGMKAWNNAGYPVIKNNTDS